MIDVVAVFQARIVYPSDLLTISPRTKSVARSSLRYKLSCSPRRRGCLKDVGEQRVQPDVPDARGEQEPLGDKERVQEGRGGVLELHRLLA